MSAACQISGKKLSTIHYPVCIAKFLSADKRTLGNSLSSHVKIMFLNMMPLAWCVFWIDPVRY